jgi:osmotically-inducible protein OsmY
MADPFNNNISDPKDVELEAAISRAIRNLGEGIHVSAHGGHVTLTGVVDDFETKREISSVVHGVGGVHDIVNSIRVARVAD